MQIHQAYTSGWVLTANPPPWNPPTRAWRSPSAVRAVRPTTTSWTWSPRIRRSKPRGSSWVMTSKCVMPPLEKAPTSSTTTRWSSCSWTAGLNLKTKRAHHPMRPNQQRLAVAYFFFGAAGAAFSSGGRTPAKSSAFRPLWKRLKE